MASNQGFGSFRHLAVRFFGALSPAGPRPDDDRWARTWMLEGEQALWGRMSGPDRRHAVGVARESMRLLGADRAPRQVVAAALLHDVGKVESSIGTFGRVGVTVVAMALGRTRLTAWSGAPVAPVASGAPVGGRPNRRARTGLYLAHDRVGAALLSAAGSDPLTVAWAGEHHLPHDRWSVDAAIGAALKEADGD